MRFVARCAFVVAVLGAGFGLAACSRSEASPSQKAETKLPVVRDDAVGLVLTYIDDRGEYLVESQPAKVPEERRDVVRVMDATSEAPDGQVFLVDLKAKRPDGTYPVTLGSRAAFDAVAEGRRKAVRPPAAPSAPAPGDTAVAAAPSAKAVVVYGASWCGACQKTRAYLKQKKIPFVDKDIEEDSSAAREMRAKLAKAGIRSQGIPVIDVGGQLMVGFDPGAIERALGGG